MTGKQSSISGISALEKTEVAKQSHQYLTLLFGRSKVGQIILGNNKKFREGVFEVSDISNLVSRISSVPDCFIKHALIDFEATQKRNENGVGNEHEVSTVNAIAFDVDANKDGYGTREQVLQALEKMPQQPTMVVNSNGPNGGFHVYWILLKPHVIVDSVDRDRLKSISRNWHNELDKILAKVRGSTEKNPASEKDIDSTYELCRFLRPVGCRRTSGNVVKFHAVYPERLYSLDQLILPGGKVDADNDSKGTLKLHDWFYRHNVLFRQEPHPNGGQQYFFDCPNIRLHTTANGERDCRIVQDADGKLGGGCFHSSCGMKSWSDLRDAIGKPDANDYRMANTANTDSSPTVRAPKILLDYLEKLRTGTLPQLIQQYSALQGIEVGPGLLTVFGAPPGVGKTALASQVMFDGLELDESLTAIVANAETSFEVLLRREFTRLTRIKSDKIRFGKLTEHDLEQITEKSTSLLQRLQRVQVLQDPHSLDQLMRLITEPPGLLIVDYIQKFAPIDKDARQGVNMVMNGLRMLAKKGWSVLALSSTSRSKDGSHNPANLTLSSFKESGEVEFNVDAGYLLIDSGPTQEETPYIRKLTLKCVKNRHGDKIDMPLIFHMPRMEFTKPVAQSPPHSEFAACQNDPFCVEDPF